MEFSRKGNKARKIENTRRVSGMTECMINCTESSYQRAGSFGRNNKQTNWIHVPNLLLT